MRAMVMSRGVRLLAMLLLMAAAWPSSAAESDDPAAAQVESLHAGLLKTMKSAPSVSMNERYRDLKPVIEQVYALPLMLRYSIGPDWLKFSPEQQQSLIAAFTRYTIANYLQNFRGFNGERFVLEGVTSRGDEKIVSTRLVPVHDAPVPLLYRMRNVEGTWKIVDVIAEGVSSLAIRRSDFSSALAAGGVPVLIEHLDKVSADLMK